MRKAILSRVSAEETVQKKNPQEIQCKGKRNVTQEEWEMYHMISLLEGIFANAV